MPRSASLNRPSPGDPDRKRVLNVLAQRRYRQRKKERFAALEAQAKTSPGSTTTRSHESEESTTSPESSAESNATLESSGVSLPQVDNTVYPDLLLPLDDDDGTFDLEALLQQPSDLDMSTDTFLFHTDTTLPAHIRNPSYPLTTTPPPQTLPPPTLSMDLCLEIPLLKLLTACTTYARLLGCDHLLWNPSSLWTFPASLISSPDLPATLTPTPSQLSIPHHPLFDLLPWPQLRTKLICIFALPPQHRPANAREPEALMQLAFDIDDETDGFRVNGEGNSREEWEVGEAFFRNWWWALDRGIVESSDRWRVRRGQRRLAVACGTVGAGV